MPVVKVEQVAVAAGGAVAALARLGHGDAHRHAPAGRGEQTVFHYQDTTAMQMALHHGQGGWAGQDRSWLSRAQAPKRAVLHHANMTACSVPSAACLYSVTMLSCFMGTRANRPQPWMPLLPNVMRARSVALQAWMGSTWGFEGE
jgi:hypothetical protein